VSVFSRASRQPQRVMAPRSLLLVAVATAAALARSGVQAQCTAATYDAACTGSDGDTIASTMPAGGEYVAQVWYEFQLVAGTTYTFYGESLQPLLCTLTGCTCCHALEPSRSAPTHDVAHRAHERTAHT
jgi:hypothetical protein